jgi:DNA (cytosine-5)-methyltransferase 1
VAFLTINYNKLWKLLIDKGLNKTKLGISAGVSTSTISKMGRNEPVAMESLIKICKVLECNIGDIMDLVDD